MEIVPLSQKLVPEVAKIEQLCFSEPWSEQAYFDALHREDYCYLVAINEQGKAVGMCGLIIGPFEAEVTNVAVHPDYRGQGIANLLLEALLQSGDKTGITAYTLEVRTGNHTAIHLYEKFGFAREGIRPDFYRKPTEDALIMWRR